MSYAGALDPSATWTGRLRGSEHFPSPFMDMASLAMPENLGNALEWCEYIFQSNATYRMAAERILSYFVTDIEIGSRSPNRSIGDDEKDRWHRFLTDDLAILTEVQNASRNRMCYGNDFVSIQVPFLRTLMCPRGGCGFLAPLREVYQNKRFKFRFSNCEFHARCPVCGYDGIWDVKDEPKNEPSQLKIKHWSPHEMQILFDPFTERSKYLWKIPEDYKRLVRNGEHLFYLENVDREVLKAIKNNQLFEFAPGVIYHMKEPTLAGANNRGWGISRVITNFRQVWYVQVLHRYNESIALDYVIPFRLLTPAASSGSQQAGGQLRDPLMNVNMGNFMGEVRQMLRRRRRDPASWHTLPYPVEYQALGGEASQMAPHELLNQGIETMLNAAGTPVELYKGTLQLQTAPVSMRLFEATWHHLVYDNNAFLRWVVERTSKLLSWETVDVRHKRVTHADDMQRHMALLQLMMGGTISQTTGLRALGLEFRDESRLIQDEARYTQEQTAQVQKEMDTRAYGQQVASGQPMGGAPAQGAAPAPGAAPGASAQPGAPPSGVPIDPATGMPLPTPVSSMVQNNMMPQTPDEILAQAESLAQQLLGLPESQKDSELRLLKQKNELLHMIVVAKLDQIRGRARSQGGSMLIAQQFGG